ncbi:MAG TPA: dipeptide/oligopeptide/nickel ABC transporter permease/ATP-binding protein [Cellulomonas sp.]
MTSSPISDGPAATTPATRPAGPRSVWRTALRRPQGAVSAAVLVVVVTVAVLAPVLAPHDPDLVDLGWTNLAPGGELVLGGDGSGRDTLSRLIYGARSTLLGGFVAVAVAILLGVPCGLLAGFYGGRGDKAISWVSDLVQAIPGMIVLLVVAAGTSSSFLLIMVTLGVLLAPGFVRLTRSAVAAVRHELYVEAARVAGLSDVRIILVHVLRSVRSPILIQAMLSAGIAMGMQAGLQFLGIGDTESPTWGAMMADAFRNLHANQFLLVPPAVALGVTVAALASLGSVLADASRPRQATRPRRARDGRRGPAGGRRTPTAVGASRPATAVRPADPGRDPADELAVDLVGLRVSYPAVTERGAWREVVHGIDLSVRRGETVGLVGESGSGKTQTLFALLDLLPASARLEVERLRVLGVDATGSRRAMRGLLGSQIGYVPQEPMTNLDPSYTIGRQLVQPLREVLGMNAPSARRLARELLDRVGIVDPDRVLRQYPHEISGGMAQRVLIAGAVACQPTLLVADEPTTALDVTVQAEVLELLRSLQEEFHTALLIVTHNFGVVADLCERVVVLKDGAVVESASVDAIFSMPTAQYTRDLIGATLDGTPSRRALDDAARS